MKLTKIIWTWPKRFGPNQNNSHLSKTIWWVRNHIGPIEGQGINVNKNFNSSCWFQNVLYFQWQKWQILVNSQYPTAFWTVKWQRWKRLRLSMEGSWFYCIWRKPNNCNVWLWTDLSCSAWHLQILVGPKKTQKKMLIHIKQMKMCHLFGEKSVQPWVCS